MTRRQYRLTARHDGKVVWTGTVWATQITMALAQGGQVTTALQFDVDDATPDRDSAADGARLADVIATHGPVMVSWKQIA